MYKKMHIVVGFCSGLYGIIVGMEREIALQQLICKNIIPILAVNNYVMPVPNAYKALEKEASLIYESIEKIKFMGRSITEEVNKNIRTREGLIFPIKKNSREVLHPSGCSLMRCISILYKNSSPCRDQLKAHVKIVTRVYRVRPAGFTSMHYCQYKYVIKNINALKKEIERLLPPDKPSVCIELSLGNKHVSDCIVVKNRCDAVVDYRHQIEHKKTPQKLPSLELLQEDTYISSENNSDASLNIDARDITFLSDDLEKNMGCAPLCKRVIVAVVGFLSLYLLV